MSVDMRILESLDQNAKLTAKELAVMLGETEENVAAAIAEMEEERVICGYPTLINWEKTERQLVTAMIEVKVTPQRGQGFDKIAERIYQFDEVDAVYLMSGGFDLCVMIHGKTLQSVAEFVSSKLSPMDSADLMKVRSFRLSAWARISLALLTQLVRPMTIITFTMPEPKSATTIRTRKKVGIIMKMLMKPPKIMSTLPPKKPATPPSSVPITAAMSAEMLPIIRETRVP